MHFSDADILAARSPKLPLDPWKPYAFLVEPERTATGSVDDVATIFLTNKECPFRCTMCDLWKYTLDKRVPLGAIPAQIDYALERLPATKHIKLYNAGNFFDSQAIPAEDHEAIAGRVRHFETVIVENHPRLIDDRCVRFRDLIATRLEVALGLETIHPVVLISLNKRMNLQDFDRAATFLRQHDFDIRTFLLLKPPGLDEQGGVDWALKSIEYSFNAGAGCCSLIPTRTGNGFMDQLQSHGEFSSPTIHSMEDVLERGIMLGRGRVFMDLWDVEEFCNCSRCGSVRIERLRRMNLFQQVEQSVECSECEGFRL